MHLSSARILSTTEDAAAAFVTAYDAARKSLSAMLAVQGLRARGGDGGHRRVRAAADGLATPCDFLI
jgi:hypothetical protein